jgi:hypothetical protein
LEARLERLGIGTSVSGIDESLWFGVIDIPL